MNDYTIGFLARDHVASMVIAADRDRLLVHVPESPPPGPRPASRIAAWAWTLVHPGRSTRPLSAQATD